MREIDQPIDFTVTQKVIHWVMGILIILMLFAAQGFNEYKEVADRIESRTMHGSAGLILGVLLLFRLFMRWAKGAPPLPDETPGWERFAANASHIALYLIMAGLILSGIAAGVFSTLPMQMPVLGGFDISVAQNQSDQVFANVRKVHEVFSDIAFGFLALHIGAAFFHLFWKRDRITQKMSAFWKSHRNPA